MVSAGEQFFSAKANPPAGFSTYTRTSGVTMLWELLKYYNNFKIINYYQNNKFHSILTRFCKYNKCSSINIFIDLLTLQQLSQGGGHNLKAAKHRGRQEWRDSKSCNSIHEINYTTSSA